ncbi:MAG: AAA family ATPase [bacterium]|nr:AAA family ATPase [bacterium]
MYTQFYGLRAKPFSLSPDPRYLFLADPHREALAHLLYGIEQGEGFICVTGEVGTGKTTLCRTLLGRLDSGTEVAFIFNPQLSGLELLQAINAELGLPLEDMDRRQLQEQLNRFLLAKRRDGRRVLLIIDEAQVMERDALEQVRLLSNLETNTAKLIQIVLIGQPELDTMLESPDLRQLRQRISVRWRLTPLSVTDARDYVRHRLRIAAGAPRELFTDLALREIHRRSGGIPRVINLLCDRALLAGYAAEAKAIGLGLVTRTDREARASAGSKPRGAGGWLRDQARHASSGLRLPTWIRDGALPVAAGLGLLTIAIGGWLAFSPAGPGASSGELSSAPEAVGSAMQDPVNPSPGLPTELAELSSDTLPAVGLAPPPGEMPLPDEPELPEPGMLELPDQDLSQALGKSSPAVTMAASLDALLGQWQQAPVGADLLSLPRLVEELGEQGFSLLKLREARIETLRALDLPALLVLEALDEAPRYAAATGLWEEGLRLEGIGPLAFEVTDEELLSHWTGEAYVPWRDFESLPQVVRPGAKGESVLWLQQALTSLGVLHGDATGRYDAATISGVRELQRKLELGVDGTVGPVTKIEIYRALPGYELPVLAYEDPL